MIIIISQHKYNVSADIDTSVILSDENTSSYMLLCPNISTIASSYSTMLYRNLVCSLTSCINCSIAIVNDSGWKHWIFNESSKQRKNSCLKYNV